jgi:hypothetical protein
MVGSIPFHNFGPAILSWQLRVTVLAYGYGICRGEWGSRVRAGSCDIGAIKCSGHQSIYFLLQHCEIYDFWYN